MGTWLGWIAALVAAGAVLAGVVVLAVWITMGRGPEIAAITPRDPAGLPADQVALGAALAAVGDCGVCHTKPDGAPFAGGVGLETPFGTVFSTNITPDPETGIGQWSEAAFVRSMTQGLDRAGNHLFPVFPYDHFAKVTEGDLAAIYAYLMTRPDVAEPPPADAWGFPFNQRPLLAWWKWLYLDPSPWAADPALDDEQNRGAYLVSGLGHCGACHTPRTMLGGLDRNPPSPGPRLKTGTCPPLVRLPLSRPDGPWMPMPITCSTAGTMPMVWPTDPWA